jgi:hypothetical protein
MGGLQAAADAVRAAVDGSIVEILTWAVAVVCVPIKAIARQRAKQRPYWSRRACIVDFLHGATVVPFLVLAISPLSHGMMDTMIKESRHVLMIAGGVGLLFVFGELFDFSAHPPERRRTAEPPTPTH